MSEGESECFAVDGVSPFVLECKREDFVSEMRESLGQRAAAAARVTRALAQHPWTNCEPERESPADVTGRILQKSFSTAASFRVQTQLLV